jgi:hypothetical protein
MQHKQRYKILTEKHDKTGQDRQKMRKFGACKQKAAEISMLFCLKPAMASPAPKSPEQSEKNKKYDRQIRFVSFQLHFLALNKYANLLSKHVTTIFLCYQL